MKRAIATVLSAAMLLTLAACSSYSKDDVTEAYSRGFDAGYESAIEDMDYAYTNDTVSDIIGEHGDICREIRKKYDWSVDDATATFEWMQQGEYVSKQELELSLQVLSEYYYKVSYCINHAD